ncbi:MAG TPA: DMT family transporter [Firmicutes bacterium]|nr:DMT family transporter [Bacillota bacterium]
MKLSKGDILMASAACAWGFSYIFMKMGLETITPFQMTFLRFGFAFPVLLLIFRKKVIPNRQELKYSAILGCFVFGLTVLYMYGLKTTDASTAGFLAGTTVVLVPILNAILKRKIPEKKVFFATILAICGVALMSVSDGLTMTVGAWLCIGGATCYAVQIIVTDRALGDKGSCRVLVIGVWQMAFAAVLGGIATLCVGETSLSLNGEGWIAVWGLALISSAYGYTAQTIAQKSVRPERIGFIYSLEPVFCAILAFLFFHEIMSLKELFGAILIFLSIIL